ncbi:hypothetical protein ACJJIR_10575 [Microbulbifer sp. SSSA008]|uniref:hypothetical protein n=1 Tax=Microbulbifer sp. SSSA008 TaxID=3243380 RepID=UPI0040393CE4
MFEGKLSALFRVSSLMLFLAGVVSPAFAIYEDSIQFSQSGVIDDNDTYLYAPMVMFDEVEGKYKLWACGGVAGDHIIYKESPRLERLKDVGWYSAFKPSGLEDKFDGEHTCDPSVLREGNNIYLYYGGQPLDSKVAKIGVAVSYNGGRDFYRLHGGVPVLEPRLPWEGGYGVGQPSVVKNPLDGWYYMIYTNQNGAIKTLEVIKSSTPEFTPSTIEHVTTIDPTIPSSWSVDLVWNPSRNHFVIVGNNSSGEDVNKLRVKLTHYDRYWNYVGNTVFEKNIGWRFGEGVGVLTDSQKKLGGYFSGGTHSLVFMAATWDDSGAKCKFACSIEGPVMYAQFTEGQGGVFKNWLLDGYDIALFNPNGMSNIYQTRECRRGIFR